MSENPLQKGIAWSRLTLGAQIGSVFGNNPTTRIEENMSSLHNRLECFGARHDASRRSALVGTVSGRCNVRVDYTT